MSYKNYEFVKNSGQQPVTVEYDKKALEARMLAVRRKAKADELRAIEIARRTVLNS